MKMKKLLFFFNIIQLFMSSDISEDKTRTAKKTLFGCRLLFSFLSIIIIIVMMSQSA